MCMVLWTLEHESYQLVLASNRDEYLSRPTLPAEWRRFSTLSQASSSTESPSSPTPSSSAAPSDSNDRVLSGLDLSAHGTWLGVTPSGRISVLTNFSEAIDSSRPSRGALVKDFLTSCASPTEYAEKINNEKGKYAGFNLIVGQLGKAGAHLLYVSNREETDHGVQLLDNGGTSCGPMGVSNNTLGDKAWQKVSEGKRRLETTLESSGGTSEEELVPKLFDMLATCNPTTDELADNIFIHPRHRLFTPDTPRSVETWYATRSQTVILVTRATESGGRPRVVYVERDAYRLADERDADRKPVLCVGDRRDWRWFEFEISE